MFPYFPMFSYVFLCFPLDFGWFWPWLRWISSRWISGRGRIPRPPRFLRNGRAGAEIAVAGPAQPPLAAGTLAWLQLRPVLCSGIIKMKIVEYIIIYIWLYMYIILSYYHIVWQCHILFFLAHNMYLHKKVSGKEREVLVLVFRDPEHWQHANDRSAHWMMLNDKEKNRSSSISSLRGQTSLWLWHSQFAMDAMAHRNRWFTS